MTALTAELDDAVIRTAGGDVSIPPTAAPQARTLWTPVDTRGNRRERHGEPGREELD